MTTLRLFQLLVVGRAVLAVLWHFIASVWWPSDPLIDKLLRYNAFGNLLGSTGQPLQVTFLCGLLVATVGLLFFQNWGRHLFLWLVCLLWFGSLLSGMVVLAPAYSFAFIAIQTLNGAILALAFLSSLSSAFRRTSGL